MLDITTGLDGWTDARVALLHEMFAKGLTHRAIAEQIGGGLSRNAVIGKARRLGLVGREIAERAARKFSHSGGDGTVTKIRAGIKARKLLADKDRGLTQTLNNARTRSFPGQYKTSEPPAEFLAITFADLQDDQCRFPRGDCPSVTFCGQPRIEGESYCQQCRAIAYYRPVAASQPFKFKSW